MSNALKFYIDGAWVDPAVLKTLPVVYASRCGKGSLSSHKPPASCPMARLIHPH